MTWRVLLPEGSRSRRPEAPPPHCILTRSSLLCGMLFSVHTTLKLEPLLKVQHTLPLRAVFRKPWDGQEGLASAGAGAQLRACNLPKS